MPEANTGRGRHQRRSHVQRGRDPGGSDEAGMLDQDTARALLTVVDEQEARLALVGDPHQPAAIGRGGVLDLADRWAERAVTLDVIHRFTRTTEIEPGVLADVETPTTPLCCRGCATARRRARRGVRRTRRPGPRTPDIDVTG